MTSDEIAFSRKRLGLPQASRQPPNGSRHGPCIRVRADGKRLGEFAGMLALHYTRGEDYDKAEAYMIRAGEEALKAAASSEALIYYGVCR